MQKPKRILLSIDFDYFFKENPLWDFGHAETSYFCTTAWDIRYKTGKINLIEETDPKRFADFQPKAWFEEILKKFKFNISQNCQAWTNASHAGIVPAVEMTKLEFDVLVNYDAHHDFFGDPEQKQVHCGNWGWKLKERNPDLRAFWIVPKGLKEFHTDETLADDVPEFVRVQTHKDFEFNAPAEVVGIFFARSDPWVPPHHDPAFNDMVGGVSQKLCIPPRAIWPNEKERIKFNEDLHAKLNCPKRKANLNMIRAHAKTLK